MIKFIIKPKNYRRKMDAEELQQHLKLNRGNGSHKNKKAYDRKRKDVS